MQSSNVKYVLLRWQGDIVGTGKYFFKPGEESPASSLHGSKLSWFAKRGEILVAVCGVQVFREFEQVRYPYLYGGVEDLPVFLGDLNRSKKHFKSVIAWDDRNVLENPHGTELGVRPRAVSVMSIQWYRRKLTSRSPRQLQFGSVEVREFATQHASDDCIDMVAGGGGHLSQKERAGNKDTDVLNEICLNSLNHNRQSALAQEKGGDQKGESGNEHLERESFFGGVARTPPPSRQPQFGTESNGSPMVISSEKSASPYPMALSPPSPLKLMGTSARGSSVELSPMVLTPAQRLMMRLRKQTSASKSPMSISPNPRPSFGAQSKLKTPQEPQVQNSSPDCRRRLTFSEDRGGTEIPNASIPQAFGSGAPYPASFRQELAHASGGSSSCQRVGSFAFDPSVKNLSESMATAMHRFPSNLDGVRSALAEMNLAEQKRPYRFHSRAKAAPKGLSKLRSDRLKLSKRKDNPFLKDRLCCSRECFRNVNPNYAFAQYKRFMDMSPVERKLVLHELLDRELGRFRFDNRIVCARFLSIGFRFSFSMQSGVKGTERARASSSVLAKPREVQKERKRDRIVSFLKGYADVAGEKLPMKPQINLPTLKKLQVYEKFLESLQKDRITDVPAKSYFFTVWKEECPYIKTHRYHGFTVCGECEFLRAQLHRYATNIIAQHMFRSSMRVHLKHIAEERRGYYDRRDLAVRYPEKYYSIAVDGADQQNYGLPHFEFRTKVDRGHKMKVRCIGVLEHKTKHHLNLFTMTEEFATGANHIIEAIHRTLDKKKAEEKRLPEVLFIQADNCVRENKNRYMFAYLEMLVAMGVFLEVQVSFLPVGHTHCDIDQAFSTVSGALKMEEVITMQDLILLLKTCYGRSSAEELTRVANISEMLDFTGCLTKVKHFGSYRYFRFTRGVQVPNEVRQGPYKTVCDVKVELGDDWKSLTLENTSNVVTSFLLFVPSLRNVPVTKTRVPPNVAEVNKCIEATVQRLDEGVKYKIDRLKSLRNRIYTQRIYSFHWDLSSCFEMNGDFLQPGANGGAILPRVQASDELDYEIGEFVAIKTDSAEDDPFWIGKIIRGASTSASGAVTLYLRWYVPSQTSTDLYRAAYKEATRLENGKSVPYNESIDVQSVLCNFEKLTARKCLHVRTQRAIRDALGVS